MFSKWIGTSTLLLSVVLVPTLVGQRSPLSRPQAVPGQHDHTDRLRNVSFMQQSLAVHGNFLRRMAGDHAFADQLEAAAQTGDTRMVAALFAQTTGVPVSSVTVQLADATGLGAEIAPPEFKVEQAANWTPGPRMQRTKLSSARWIDAITRFCVLGFCISVARDRASEQ